MAGENVAIRETDKQEIMSIFFMDTFITKIKVNDKKGFRVLYHLQQKGVQKNHKSERYSDIIFVNNPHAKDNYIQYDQENLGREKTYQGKILHTQNGYLLSEDPISHQNKAYGAYTLIKPLTRHKATITWGIRKLDQGGNVLQDKVDTKLILKRITSINHHHYRAIPSPP